MSSGDVTRAVIQSRPRQSIFHMGPERDRPIFAGLDVRFAPLAEADYVVCSGLFDDEAEKPDDYRPRLEQMLARRTFMVCGNPDVVVERGDRLIYCAGAIADLYAAMGGEVLYRRQAVPADLRAGAGARRAAAMCRSSACWRSAIRCGPT